MFLISKIKSCALVWLVCIAIILINTTPVIAQEACVPCNIPPVCPTCPEGSKCILPIRTCFECPKPRCSKVSPEASPDNNGKSKILLPIVIGGILGIGFFAALGYGCFVWRRKTQNERGVKLDSNEEMISVNGENVIPIAYIPSTPITPKPEPTYPRLRGSNISCGSTPFGDERLIDIEDDNVGTILQATKATKTAPTATLITATRAKPALFRINTIKQTTTNTEMSSSQSTRNENSNPNTPKTPMTSNIFLNAPSISSVPGSPNSDCSIRIGCDSETEQMMPRIDIERSSVESFHVTNQNSKSQHLSSPLLDPIEGRQSFGLFGSDEVYSKDQSPPQLQRGSIVSSSSSNGRSTLASDDGDGEIMIFWGGNAPPFVNVTGGGCQTGCQTQVKKPENHVDSTQNEEIKIKESI